MYIHYNPNPVGRKTTDCVIRAIAKAFGYDWDTAFDEITEQARDLYDMPDANHVWGLYLERNGFVKRAIPYTCPDCYTVRDFCRDHPLGLYVIGTGKHVVTAVDGDYYDTWDSGDEVPAYFFWRRM